MDSFRLYNFSPNVQAVTHKYPSKIHGVGGKTETTVLLFTNMASWTLGYSSHRLGLVTYATPCWHFVLLGPDVAGNLVVVVGQNREPLWVCSDHQCSGGEEEDKASLAANLAQVLHSQLDSEQETAIVPMGNGWEFVMW